MLNCFFIENFDFQREETSVSTLSNYDRIPEEGVCQLKKSCVEISRPQYATHGLWYHITK